MRLTGFDLVCVRNGREVFAGLGFSLASGRALMVTGPNGAGKSSLLRIVAGLLRSTAGRLVLDGGDPELSIGEQAHYVGHQDGLKPSLTAFENIQFWTRYFNGARCSGDALARLGICSLRDIPGAYLSAGQRRRLALARLIAIERPIWLLDEPTSALDAAAQQTLTEIMTDHLAAGGMILAATHGPIGLEGAAELRLTPR